MPTSTFYTLLTNIGLAKITNAQVLSSVVRWTAMAVGDGLGNPTTPTATQTTLLREKYSANINQLTVDPDNPAYLIAEMIVPTNVGGWAVNEVCIRDEEGDMVAVANFPSTYKPQLAEGSGRDLVIRIVIQVSNTATVQLKVDPTIILASQAWVTTNFTRAKIIPGGTINQLLAKRSSVDGDTQWVNPTPPIDVATQAESTTGTIDNKYISPLKLAQRLATLFNQATETVLGLTKIATQTQVNAGTDDATTVTPKKMSAGFAKGSNYIKLPQWLGGLIIQWGASVNTGIATSVTFPIAFSGGNYSLSVAGESGNLGARGPLANYAYPTNTGFSCGVESYNTTNVNAGSVAMRWLAFGV